MPRGEVIGCFGLTEPDAGSDPGTMRTHARRDGDDWILNGAKMWITNGTIADVAIVWARTDDGEIRGFLVEKGTPGLHGARDPQEVLAARVGHVRARAEDVRVPDESMLPGARRSRAALVPQRGALRDRLGRRRRRARLLRGGALDYARERIVFGKPIAAYQLTQQKLAEMALEINRGRSWRSTSAG